MEFGKASIKVSIFTKTDRNKDTTNAKKAKKAKKALTNQWK